MTSRNLPLAVGALICIAISGCANHYTAGSIQDPYGFFSGIWHGFIFPYALVVNLISWLAGLLDVSLFASVEIIGRPNTGFWYYCGFFFGICIYGGGGAR